MWSKTRPVGHLRLPPGETKASILSQSDFAWEIVRRRADYHPGPAPTRQAIDTPAGKRVTLIECAPRLIDHGGCCFEENPHRSAHDADIFWDARHDPSVIVATADAAGPSEPNTFDLFAQPIPATLLRCAEQPEELRLAIAGRAVRLSIIAGTLIEGPVHLSFHLDGSRWLEIRLRALRALDSLMRQRQIPLLPPRSDQSPRRMSMILQTMDGLAGGWSQREIAIALFGERIVASDWGGPSDFLKSRVRRLIAQVVALEGDAYLRLLQR